MDDRVSFSAGLCKQLLPLLPYMLLFMMLKLLVFTILCLIDFAQISYVSDSDVLL